MHSRIRNAWWLAVLLAVPLVGGCQVEREQPAEAPDIDVDVDPGQWPDYDVNWADVDVGTQERTVEVPVVRVVEEKRQVSVPYIDINPPNARDREERMISMELEVPHAGYQLQIMDVRAANDDLWVIGRLMETETPQARGAARVSDHVVVNAPADLDVRRVIVGERPDGMFNQQYRFVESEAALAQQLPAGARSLYQRGS